MHDIFESDRLIYRAVDAEQDMKLFIELQYSIQDYQLSNAGLKVPQGKKQAQRYLTNVMEESLLGVVICLKPLSGKKVEEAECIGVLHLNKSSPGMIVHRHTDIGIDLLPQYQGERYGSEAIMWATRWAFETAGMHHIQLRCFEYNERAVHLYEKLGFKEQGRWREWIWHKGRFWDDIQFGMLDREYLAIEAQQKTTTTTTT